MAYMSQQTKAAMAAPVKAILAKYKIKGSLSVHNHSALVLTIKSSSIDFIGNMMANRSPHDLSRGYTTAPSHMDVNTYHYRTQYSGIAKECLHELITAMNVGNHDNSDAMTDYYDVGWYVTVAIGKWDMPYRLEAS